jgi:hypothetical protein
MRFLVPYRSSAQMSCRGKVGVSFVALSISESQTHALDFDQTKSRAIEKLS